MPVAPEIRLPSLEGLGWVQGNTRRLPNFFLVTRRITAIPPVVTQPLHAMKKITVLLVAVLALSFTSARAQMGGPGAGSPDFSGAMTKFMGGHTNFSANIEVQVQTSRTAAPLAMPGKLAVLDKKSRFEMDLSQATGGDLPAGAAEQMKQMGMDKTTVISRPDKQISYLIYPGLNAYTEMPIKDTEAVSEQDLKVETTELGKEKIDGHDCVKNKLVVISKSGKTNEATVWNATDLKKFPVKLETTDRGNTVTMRFKDVKFEPPAAAQFEPPADFKKYDSMMALMQQEMMKRMGGMPPR